MMIRLTNMDDNSCEICNMRNGRIYKVLQTGIYIENPKTTPHCKKYYIVKNKYSSTGTTKVYWYEAIEIITKPTINTKQHI